MTVKDYLTVEHASKQLGLTEYRICELIREKQIGAPKIGQWRFRKDEIDK